MRVNKNLSERIKLFTKISIVNQNICYFVLVSSTSTCQELTALNSAELLAGHAYAHWLATHQPSTTFYGKSRVFIYMPFNSWQQYTVGTLNFSINNEPRKLVILEIIF